MTTTTERNRVRKINRAIAPTGDVLRVARDGSYHAHRHGRFYTIAVGEHRPSMVSGAWSTLDQAEHTLAAKAVAK